MDPEEIGQDQQVESEGQETVAEETTTQEQPKQNGAWDELLSVVPSQLHSQVTPHLQKWDSNFQKKINEERQKYEPYKDFLENNVAPEQINYSLNVLRAIDERPGEVISAIREYAKNRGISLEEAVEEVTEGEQTQQPEENEDDPILNHPMFKQMQSQVETLAQILVQQQEAEANAEEDQQLESEIAELKKQYGDFDVDWVLTKAVATEDPDLEKHVKAYQEFVDGVIAQQRKPGPKVMSGSGSAPTQELKPKDMDANQRRAYMASLLEAAHNNS